MLAEGQTHASAGQSAGPRNRPTQIHPAGLPPRHQGRTYIRAKVDVSANGAGTDGQPQAEKEKKHVGTDHTPSLRTDSERITGLHVNCELTLHRMTREKI